MTTPRDLLLVTTDLPADRPVEQGDLSLALAGAELVDLVEAEALSLDGDRIVPGLQPDLGDRLLNEAASSLIRQAPYESVEDWLWRRGRGLASGYRAVLEAEGEITRQRHRWLPLRTDRTDRTASAASPARRHAAERWTSREPVLACLAAAVRIHDEPETDLVDMGIADDAVETILATVNEAVTELESVRQRRRIEDAAFDNIWRGQ